MTTAVVIPFRDRGIDPLRPKNLSVVENFWRSLDIGPVIVASDGRRGKAQFNRSAAYNLGVKAARRANPNLYIFAESDMLLPPTQVQEGIRTALHSPGLVVPFTQYRYLGSETSCLVRDGAFPEDYPPQYTMNDGRSIGAIGIVTVDTLKLISQWDEMFEGSWYDDDAMKIAFEACAGPTRWVQGPAHHLYHLPGYRGPHLTTEDRAATARNRKRLGLYRKAAHDPDLIRELTRGMR